jgi:2-oxoisovalerate dehydrogenase E2 component (dihydrolipoyl transacylase)
LPSSPPTGSSSGRCSCATRDGLGGERIEKRKLMNLSISCDHRVVDGYDAAAFVQEVKRLIETPVLLLAG